MTKTHSATFKAQVVLAMLREENTVGQLAAEYGVHPSQLHRWKRQALDRFTHLFADPPAEQAQAAVHEKQLAELYAEIGKLTTQLAWIKKKSGLDPDAR